MAKYYGGVSESSGNTGATQGNTGGDPFASGAAQSDPFSSGASQDALSSTASQAGALSSDTAQLDQAPSQMLQGSVQQTQLFGEVSNDFANQPPGNPSGGGCSMPPLKAMTPKLDTTPPGQTPKVPPPPPNIPLIPETATSQTPPPTKPLIGKVVQNKFILEVSKTQVVLKKEIPQYDPRGKNPPPKRLIGRIEKRVPRTGDNSTPKPNKGNKNKPVDLKSDKAKPDKEKEKDDKWEVKLEASQKNEREPGGKEFEKGVEVRLGAEKALIGEVGDRRLKISAGVVGIYGSYSQDEEKHQKGTVGAEATAIKIEAEQKLYNAKVKEAVKLWTAEAHASGEVKKDKIKYELGAMAALAQAEASGSFDIPVPFRKEKISIGYGGSAIFMGAGYKGGGELSWKKVSFEGKGAAGLFGGGGKFSMELKTAEDVAKEEKEEKEIQEREKESRGKGRRG